MTELEHLNDFVVQNSNTERTIKCTPEGVGLEKYADICDSPGAPEEVQQLLRSPVSVLRSVPSSDGQKASESAINTILSVLIANESRFVSLEQYVWLARVTISAELLIGMPEATSSLANRLFSVLEEIDTSSYSYSPWVIHLLTKSLFEDIPLQGVNLLCVIKKLAISNSMLLYYAAVCLIFTGLDAITGSGNPSYRLYSVDDFFSRLNVLNMERLHRERHNLQIIYQLLKLLSFYENMVLMHHFGTVPEELDRKHRNYVNFFRVTDQQRRMFQLWLEKSSALVHLFGNDRDVDYLILADLIQVDMLPLFDDFHRPHDLL